MKGVFVSMVLVMICAALSAQNILVLEKPGTSRNFFYRESDPIRVRQHSTGSIVSGRIGSLSDSVIFLEQGILIELEDIAAVYRQRWGFSLLQRVALIAGPLYLGIPAINGIVNNDSPLIPRETLIIGGSITLGGILLTPLTSRKIKPGKGIWRLVILDFER